MPNCMNVAAFRNYLNGKGVKNNEMVYGQIEKALEDKEAMQGTFLRHIDFF
jgi:hypothetical protein